MAMKIEEIVKNMTIFQKALMLSGKNTWQTMDFEEFGIPSVFMADGPHGIRRQVGAGDHLGLNTSEPATCFPPASTVANSWDEELAETIGSCLGKEAKNLGVQIILGPGLNTKRNPLCGRCFEYYSEDPYLSGKMAAAYIRGIEGEGVGACPKHFAANSQEFHRMTSDSVMDERTFRELYTTGFEIAVKEGRPRAIMTSYNKINGVYANENPHLLEEILRKEWGFDGIVISDWGGSNDHVEGVRCKSHLEMPSTGPAGAMELVEAVKSGVLPKEVLDQRVGELLSVVFQLADQRDEEKRVYGGLMEEHHQIARRSARESIVLLKNDGHILPLKKDCRVAVIGNFAAVPRYQGAGSSIVNAVKVDTTLECLSEYELMKIGYSRGYEINGAWNEGLAAEAETLANQAEVILCYMGLPEISETEGLDRSHMHLPDNQAELLKRLAKINSHIVVVLSAGSVVEMPWIEQAQAVIHGFLGGQAGAGAMLEVLTGRYCPGGKLADSYPFRYEDVPSSRYYPGREKTCEYREGIYVGYRYYETVGMPVRFPFGYGLSYTGFQYTNLEITPAEVRFTIENTGMFDGAEIAQLYVGREAGVEYGPVKELKGFRKVFLKKGESREVRIPFDDKSFRFYDVAGGGWKSEGGRYRIYIGASVQDIRLEGGIGRDGIRGDSAGGDRGRVPDRSELPSYCSGHVECVGDEEFELLLGHPIPEPDWNRQEVLGYNDTISQMFYARSWLGRALCCGLRRRKERMEQRGIPDLNILFLYEMPFRAIAKMTAGLVSRDMGEALLVMVNGRFFRGAGQFLSAFFRNKKLRKAGRKKA